MKLLSPAASNAKTAKGKDLPYEAAILHLSPADRSGYMTCPYASPGCKHACLNTAGHGGIGGDDNSVQRARIRKTRLFFEDRAEFMRLLVADIEALVRKARKTGKQPVVRLNGTSDLGWMRIPCERDGLAYANIFHAFESVWFYDYTKVPSRIGIRLPMNYKLTFSLSESNDAHAAKALASGMNVAVVIDLAESQPFPTTWSGYTLVDGTTHDFRFLDPAGPVIVGLRPKGRAKHDGSGFVRKPDARIDPSRALTLALTAV